MLLQLCLINWARFLESLTQLNQILVFLARTTLDCKTIGFILKISKKKKGKERRKGLRRAKHASLTPVRACQAREKKTDCPFSIQ